MMKRILALTGVIALSLLMLPSGVSATPSTTYWTPATTDIQGYGVLHIGVDNYFTLFRKASRGGGSFPTDFGLTIGVLPYEKIQAEIGFDLLESSDNPLYFNAKIGTPEGTLFPGSPAVNLGIFNVGTKKDVTNQNIVHLMFGKSIGSVRVFGGPYVGNKKALVDKDGNKENTGFMAAFDYGFMPVKDSQGEFNRLVLAADYASGKNALGGGGVGLYYYFTRDISLLTGPVWFNEKAINGEWKWTIQLDINLDLKRKKVATK